MNINIDLSEAMDTTNKSFLPFFQGRERFPVLVGGAGCYPCGTEFLSPRGWRQIEKYNGSDLILQIDKNLNTSFTKPIKYIDVPVDQFIQIKNDRVDFTTSLEHKHLVISDKGIIHERKTVQLLKKHNSSVRGNKVSFFTTFNYDGEGIPLSDALIRLKIATIADGHFPWDRIKGTCRVNVKKQRKKKRLRYLLKLNGLDFTEKKMDTGFSIFVFRMDRKERKFRNYWYKANRHQLNVICDEVLKWDGSIVNREERVSSLSFSSTSRKSVDFIQFAFSASGNRAVISVDNRKDRKDCYCVGISKYYIKAGISINKRAKNTTVFNKVDSKDGRMYCFTAPTGYFIVRQKGKIYVSGNSGKSWAIAQKIVLRILKDFDVPFSHKFLALRKTAAASRRSVFPLFERIIYDWKLQPITKINLTNSSIRFANNSWIHTGGLDKPDKLKSIEGITSAWLEETTEFNKEDWIQANLRIRGDTHSYKQVVCSLNPISKMSWTYPTLVQNPPPGAVVYNSTYLDNEYLDEGYEVQLKALAGLDENYYNVYAKGIWGHLSNIIFNTWELIDEFPEGMNDIVHGVDFGFNVPSAVVKIGEKDDVFYLDEMLYETKLTNTTLIKKMLDLKIDTLIYCDSSEPDRIKEMNDEGLNAKKAYKGKNSVKDGIDYIKTKKLYITKRSINLIKEIQSYCYMKDSAGNVLDTPVKYNDHITDAFRYGIFTHWKKRQYYGCVVAGGV